MEHGASTSTRNEEQYDPNLNIDSVMPSKTEDRLGRYRLIFLYKPCLSVYNYNSWGNELVNYAREEQPTLYFASDSIGFHRCFTNVGTAYQYVGTADEVAAVLKSKGTASSTNKPNLSQNTLKTDKLEREISSDLDRLIISQPTDSPSSQKTGCHASAGTSANTAADKHKHITKKLKWAYVRCNSFTSRERYKKIGSQFEFTTHAKELFQAPIYNSDIFYDEDGKPLPRMYSLPYCPGLAQALQMPEVQQADFRPLALKVALLDMQREKHFSQPSGVEWGWAHPRLPERDIIVLSSLGKWHYDAVFVTAETIEYAMNNDAYLPVSNEEKWYLRSGCIIFIGIPNDFHYYNNGLALWILSHLKHPLAWVLDTFEMERVGAAKSQNETFCSTAGLVNVCMSEYALVFILPTKTSDRILLGNHYFSVFGVDNPYRMGSGAGPEVYNMDEAISELVLQVLESQYSLRTEFDTYVKHMISGKIDWLEIDNLVNVLTIRYHQRIEGYRSAENESAQYIGAPRYVLQEMGLQPAAHIDDNVYHDYGGTNAVTALDQQLLSYKDYETTLYLGAWNNNAEIGLTLGWFKFNTKNTTKADLIQSRLTNSVLDKLQRSIALRAALELWKREEGIQELFASQSTFCPDSDEEYKSTELKKLAKVIIGYEEEFSWSRRRTLKVNVLQDNIAETLTGLRTTSAQWRHVLNTESILFDFLKPDDNNPRQYCLSRRRDFFYNMFLHRSNRDRHYSRHTKIEFALGKVNLVSDAFKLCYCSDTNYKQVDKVAFCVDSSHGARLAYKLGIRRMTDPPPMTWSWGVPSYIRHVDHGQICNLTLVFDKSAANCMMSPYFLNDHMVFLTDKILEVYYQDEILKPRSITFL